MIYNMFIFYLSVYLGRSSDRAKLTNSLHQFLSSIKFLMSSTMLSKFVSLLMTSMKSVVFLPLPALPRTGCQSTSWEAISSGCLTQCPASRSLCIAIFVVTLGKSPYNSSLVMCCRTHCHAQHPGVHPIQPLSICFVNGHVFELYNNTDSTVAMNRRTLMLLLSDDVHTFLNL